MLSQPKIVLFDFDGVIADTFALCHGINQHHDPLMTVEEYRQLFEGNINEAKLPRPVPSLTKDTFYDHYIANLTPESLFVGLPQIIRDLSQRYTLVIVSSTIDSAIDDCLTAAGLRKCFDQILGNTVHPSKVEKIRRVLEHYQVEPTDCLFVTDTLGDIREAAILGVKSLGVTWGYHQANRLSRGEPLSLIDNPNELVPAIERYFGR